MGLGHDDRSVTRSSSRSLTSASYRRRRRSTVHCHTQRLERARRPRARKSRGDTAARQSRRAALHGAVEGGATCEPRGGQRFWSPLPLARTTRTEWRSNRAAPPLTTGPRRPPASLWDGRTSSRGPSLTGACARLMGGSRRSHPRPPCRMPSGRSRRARIGFCRPRWCQ